jgi:integrase
LEGEKMRFPNGYGGVVKLSGNRRKPYAARITIGWDPAVTISKKTGKEYHKQLYKVIGYFEDKPSALNALVKYKEDPIPPKADITFQEVYDEWSKSKYEYISKSTADNYRAGWKYLSKFGKVKMKELRTSQLQSVIDGCYKAKMSRSTLSKIKLVAVMLYDYAMENDIVSKNYAEYIKLPKVEKEEKEVFTDIEIQKLEKAADAVPWVDTILILIYSGMRINEMLGLTKFSVDFERQVITGGLKTDAGKDRIIPIHPKILKYIKKWYDKNGEYLICNDKGKHMSDNHYRKKFYYPALKALKIRKLNPHCCRHTCASLMSKNGVDPKVIQLILGHSDYAFTANTYTHLDLDELKKGISKI